MHKALGSRKRRHQHFSDGQEMGCKTVLFCLGFFTEVPLSPHGRTSTLNDVAISWYPWDSNLFFLERRNDGMWADSNSKEDLVPKEHSSGQG